VVGFGLSRVLQELMIVEPHAAYLLLAAVGALDAWLLYRFFSRPPVRQPSLTGLSGR
jgi:hypothetical protein